MDMVFSISKGLNCVPMNEKHSKYKVLSKISSLEKITTGCIRLTNDNFCKSIGLEKRVWLLNNSVTSAYTGRHSM